MAVAKPVSLSGRPRPASVSRYDRRTHNTRMPPNGLAKPPASVNVEAVMAAVVDPSLDSDGRERLFVSVNRRVDTLELERSNSRISEAAYQTGRAIQATFEKLGRVGGSNWQGGSRIDALSTQEHRMQMMTDQAKAIGVLFERIRGRLGMIDARLIRRILGDRMSFDECAAIEGKAGDRGQRYISSRFRDALEDLAEAWSAKGKAVSAPADKYSAEWNRRAEEEQAALAKEAEAAVSDALDKSETQAT